MSCRLLECLDAIEKRVELLRQSVQSLEIEKDSLVEILRRFSDSPELETVSVNIVVRVHANMSLNEKAEQLEFDGS